MRSAETWLPMKKRDTAAIDILNVTIKSELIASVRSFVGVSGNERGHPEVDAQTRASIIFHYSGFLSAASIK